MAKQKQNQEIEIIAQCYGLKNLAIEGGWRFTIDLFEARLEDVKALIELVSEKANISVKIGRYS